MDITILNLYLETKPTFISSSPINRGNDLKSWFNINIKSNWSRIFPNRLLNIQFNTKSKNKEFIFTTSSCSGYNVKNITVTYKDISNLYQLYRDTKKETEKKIYIYDDFITKALRTLYQTNNS